MEIFISADEIKELRLSKGCVIMLSRLLNRRICGGKHMPEVIVKSWIKHLPKQERKDSVRSWEACKKEGLVLFKPKPGEMHVSLNPKRLNQIEEIIKGRQ
ncbi:hypothetical protein HYU15_00035 [Candidatus Woesearchaeota archaeon]|nr:hypothetical protein [Candidatus Woesearchaeota archaeon]